MNFEQLSYVKELYELESMIQASETMHISQSIANLEKELGYKLFSRSRKGTTLTEAGKRLIPFILEILESKEALLSEIDTMRTDIKGTLRVATIPTLFHIIKKEIFTGKYHLKSTINRDAKVENITIRENRTYKGTPQGMQFFSIEPSNENFLPIIGINDESIFIAGIQGGHEYFNELLDHSKTLKLKEVYNNFKNSPELFKVEEKINFTNSNPNMN